jgi:hypothetical protein
MKKIFIRVLYIPKQERPDNVDINTCLEINLPDQCKHCGHHVVIGNVGDVNSCGNLNGNSNICAHFMTWDSLWKNRITNLQQSLNKIAAAEVLDPLDDGCKCNKCGLFYSMAAPNQIDNTFKCYTCRNRGW